jgi:putative copper export protein
MHIFGVIVWLGGLMFQNSVSQPVVKFESREANAAMRKVQRRFTAFIWMSVWTIAITGVIMMLLSPRFFWFHYDDRWSVLLGLKQLAFILMTFYAFGHARMLSYIERASANGHNSDSVEAFPPDFVEAFPAAEVALAVERAGQFRKVSIALGITATLMAAAMV